MNPVSQEILPLCSSILNSKNVVFTVLFPYSLNLQGKMCKTVGPEALVGGFGDSEECQDSYFPLLSVFALILAKAFCAVGSDKTQGWDRCVFTLCLCKCLHFKKLSLEAFTVEQMFKSITKCAKPVKKWMGTNSCIKQTDNTLVTCFCYVDTYRLTIVMQRGTPSHRGVEAGIHDQRVSCWSSTSCVIHFFLKTEFCTFPLNEALCKTGQNETLSMRLRQTHFGKQMSCHTCTVMSWYIRSPLSQNNLCVLPESGEHSPPQPAVNTFSL